MSSQHQANGSHSRHAYAGASGHTLRLLAAGFVLGVAAASLLFHDSTRRLVSSRPALMPAGPGTRALAGCACAPCPQRPAEAAGGRRSCPPPRRQWNPLMLPVEDKRWVHSWAHNASLPSMVDPTRRQLSMELGIGAVLSTVEGDFVETGVAAGGTAILLAKVLERYDPSGPRLLWAADSFQGLPPPTEEDQGGHGLVGIPGDYATAEAVFFTNMARYGVQLERVRVLKGWFNDTLPKAGIGRIAYLRLDGDLFASTWGPLQDLYDKVSPGGMIYVDDYNSFTGCKRAVDAFRALRNITVPLQQQYFPEQRELKEQDFALFEAVWWVKE